MSVCDSEYKEFSEKLVLGGKPMLGVRLPVLRTMAREAAKGGWRAEILDEAAGDIYFEEVMLRGMIIGYGCSRDSGLEEALRFLDYFAPLIDNWSVCDSFCVSFGICEKYRDEFWQHLQQYLYSDREFEVRTGLVLLLNHYLKAGADGKKVQRRRNVGMPMLWHSCNEQPGSFTAKILEVLDRPFAQGYYAQMAAAWLVAECFAVFPAHTAEFLADNRLDPVTFNRAIQKICESRIPDAQVKQHIRKMKRRNYDRS